MCIESSVVFARCGVNEILFAKTFEATKFLLDELVTCLAEVGLQLNVGTAKKKT